MKKRIFSTLLALCMLLCLMPTAAFAEESTETPPACSCETACTAESMNTDCPVCGAEGADPKKCKCAQPADDAAAQPKGKVSTPQPEEEASDPQPEGKVSTPQPETALTALSGEGETPAASGTVTDVSNAVDLTAAIADAKVNTVRLTGDINISTSLTVNRTVTLDLNGFVLKYQNDSQRGSVIVVEGSGNLTLTDSNTNPKQHKFTPDTNGLWVSDENGSKTVSGGVITGGTGYPIQFGSGYTAYYGGAVYIKSGGKLTMEGGNIVGCSAVYGGGVYVEGEFVMTGGSIIGCAADRGGGVYMKDNDAVFNMSGSAAIRCCKAVSSIASGGGVYALGVFTMSDSAAICDCECITGSGRAAGGGVYVSYNNKNTEFTMSGNAVIENCKVTASAQNGKSYGGGVLVSSKSSLTLKDQAAIRKCSAKNTADGATYGGGIFAEGTLTIAGLAEVDKDCSAAVGSGIYMEVGPNFIVSQNLYANGGVIAGEVVLNNSSTHGVTLKITGSNEGVTEFNGSVRNNNGIIEKGTFTGEVINNGTITGGVFNSTVSGSGIINGGTFNGTPARVTGNGTENDPYQISTADGLKWFRDKVNRAKTSDETKICAVLTANIDLNNEPWTPIGPSESSAYTGTFDGQGHTVKNLSVTVNVKPGRAGLFGCVIGGAIRKLTVAGSVSCTVDQGWCGGIAGYAKSETIENCASLCTISCKGIDAKVGGIVGYVPDSSPSTIIRDCYNIGNITGGIDNGGSYTGGICGFYLSGQIFNCYNVGEITGGNYIDKIAVYGYNEPTNCYYLSDTDTDTVPAGKTAAQFADGTVLKLLKAGERDNNADPWADECKYLDAAGKTLPVFKGQGDAHDHQSNDWEHNETEHWQVCTCGVVFNKAKHSGGKATCKDKAVCEICGKSYGSLDPNNHTDLKHINAKAATAAAEGNIEYWYCEDCDKYFSDAAAAKEITKADTVTAKLPKTTSPQPIVEPRPTAQPQQTAQPQPPVQPVSPIPSTGDTANPALWFALLFVSGGAALGTTIIRRKKKQ